MIQVFPILFGALFTVSTAWSLGMLLLRYVAAPIFAWERRLLAFVAGSACLSAIMFVLSAAKLIYPAVLLALGAAIIGYAAYAGAFRSAGKAFPPLPPLWRWIFVAAFAAFTWYGFFNALAPEHSSDGMAYHLSEVRIYQQAHGFPPMLTDMYARLSQGVEMLFLFAFEFGKHSAATLVHYCFLIALVFLVLSYGRRIERPAVGVAGAIFTYSCPVVLRDASVAYIDVALTAVLFALFYLLQIWDETRDPKLFLPIGILAGFGYAAKYTAFLAVPYALGFVAWRLWRAKKPIFRPLITIALLTAVMILPWMAKNWIEVANPFSPLGNHLFPNPYIHISLEDLWRHNQQIYTPTSRWQIPLEVMVKGEQLDGFLGPLFLLTPLALLALRFREGRRLLFAGLLFVCTYFSNVGTRFLIPMVPFMALAIPLAVANLPWLVLLLLAADVITCWPRVYRMYAGAAWRIEHAPIAAALRIQSEDEYLRQDPDYKMATMINRVVPPGEKILAVALGGGSYLEPELLTGYRSAAGEIAEEILWTPVVPAYQPVRSMKFDFPERELRKLRVVLKGSEPLDQWSIAELRVFDAGKELPREPAWRLTAHPNPWDVQMAFDNSPVTRWRSWQPAAPGMFIEVDFGRLEPATSVLVESSYDAVNTRIALEGMGKDGQWAAISDRPAISAHALHLSLRMAATAELKARGIRYVFYRPDDPGAADVLRYPAGWGMKLLGELAGSHIYYIY
jgi:hypothetical protein